VIHGTRVLLRPVEERDHALIHAWQNDPEVWWPMDYEGPFSMQDIVESERRAREEGHPYVIEVDGIAIGRIGLNAFRRRDRICSLYILIGERSAWERGYGTDAVAALVDEAFDRYDLHRVELWSTADKRARHPRLREMRLRRGWTAVGAIVEGRRVDRPRGDVGDARGLRSVPGRRCPATSSRSVSGHRFVTLCSTASTCTFMA
jgi:hypothetical protein